MAGDEAHAKRKRIVVDALFGLCVVAVVIALNWWTDNRALGRQLRGFFDVAAFRISLELNPDPPRVHVINLRGMPKLAEVPCPQAGRPHFVNPLDRSKLLSMIRAVSSNKQALPYSIGVDADFGPCDGRYVVADDPQFFDALLDLERRQFATPGAIPNGPIYLGIFRGGAGDPANWLRDEKYESLAANIGIPSHDPARTVAWIEPPGTSARGYGIASRLAFPHGPTQGHKVDRWSWLRSEDAELPSANAAVAGSPVDFRPLPLIKNRVIDLPLSNQRTDEQWTQNVVNPLRSSAASLAFDNEIVLFGIVDQGPDNRYVDGHAVPGFGDQPGVMVHAAAANSLRVSRFYELQWRWRILLDLICSIAILGLVTAVRWHHVTDDDAPDKSMLARFWGVTLGVLVVFAALLMLLIGQVMWDDALLLGAVLALHSLFEGIGEKIVHGVRTFLVWFWRRGTRGRARRNAP